MERGRFDGTAWTRAWVVAGVGLLAACPAPVDDDDSDDDDDPVVLHAPLVAAEVIAPGDPDCPDGGVRLLTGVDDGAGDGVADDGVLQPGEVDTTQVVCNGATPVVPDPENPWAALDVPDGPVGTATIDLSGGNGAAGTGGEGGTLSLTMDPPPLYGHLVLARTGSVDASFPTPTPVVDTGPTGWEVTEDTVVAAMSEQEGADLPAGGVFLVTNAARMARSTGTGVETVSGVHVAPGATLTLSPNRGDLVDLSFTHDLSVDGTLTTAIVGGTRHASAMILLRGLVTSPGSAIDLSGADGDATTRGLQGGTFQVAARQGTPTYPTDLGRIVVAGRVDTSGGDGNPAGSAGGLLFSAQDGVTLTGPLSAAGGDSLGDGAATAGAPITLRVSAGPLKVSGPIDMTAGNGGPTGQNAGHIDAQASGVWFASDVTAAGGTASACATRCDGGDGGSLLLQSLAGPMFVTGSHTAPGGDGVGTTVAGGAEGGPGGGVDLEQLTGQPVAPGPASRLMAVGMTFDLRGGDGSGAGGSGGNVDITGRTGIDPTAALLLYGYDTLVLDGGTGGPNQTGGLGGELALRHGPGSTNQPTGSIRVDADLVARGGAGTIGGGGGAIGIEARNEAPPADDHRIVVITGTADLSGGPGTTTGGASGQYAVRGAWGVRSELVVRADGGPATATQGTGGGAGTARSGVEAVVLQAVHGTVEHTGELWCGGGDAVRRGGVGGRVRLSGVSIRQAGTVAVPGGDASLGVGGNGGMLFVDSIQGTVDLTGGVVDVLGGVGDDTLGADGHVLVDGEDVTADWLP
ncbi:MAG: hypothetical protein H6733_14225 [Alphaproteobacteria bacterium]|nr:hypothetical protein [Alphaproteobacteria bacterium]